jgi:hypothetical protein
MSTQIEAAERHDRTIRAWLLALLRFAVTRDNDDRLAVLATASEIDKLSAPQDRTCGFRFFHRTSAELCAAITDPRPGSAAVLHRHLERMTDERMRRTFAAALELDQTGLPVQRTTGTHGRSALWKGLAAARPGIQRL